MRTEIKLIIFDNDGVLIDSEMIWHQFFVAELARLGHVMTVKQSLQCFSAENHGNSIKDCLEKVLGIPDIDVDLSKIGAQTEASYPRLLKPVQNIEQVLDFIDSKNIQKCIASNGDIRYIKRTLDITGLRKYFADETIFGVEDKTQRKPNPYVFLQAADKFSVHPEHCLIIEDHAFGIEAAKKAGIQSLGFLGAGHAQYDEHRHWMVDSAPEWIINDSLELLDWLKKMI